MRYLFGQTSAYSQEAGQISRLTQNNEQKMQGLPTQACLDYPAVKKPTSEFNQGTRPSLHVRRRSIPPLLPLLLLRICASMSVSRELRLKNIKTFVAFGQLYRLR